MTKMLLATLLLSSIALLSGCESANPDEDTLPWSTPATWEHQKLPMAVPTYQD